MGFCSSKESSQSPEEAEANRLAQQRSKELERELVKQNQRENQIHKLLLLGAGESGKSTLFKQMITIYGKGFPEAERKTYVPIIQGNIISSIKTLVEQSEILSRDHGIKECAMNNPGAKKFVEDLKQDLKPEDAKVISELWTKNSGIQATYANRAKFQLTDSAAYFFAKVLEVCNPNYIPSEQDVLRSRVRTTGIVENAFEIDGNTFKLFDVGGQRNERKKWIHCFSEVTAVLFVAALSEYDQVLFEDESTNRLDEAINLFDEICNSQWFKKTAMILFLNKRDLFAEKIVKVPLTVWNPEYDGLSNYDEASQFIENAFLSKNRNRSKQVYTHITCATDTATMRVVFNAVKDIIIRKSLQEGGLLA